MQRVYLDLNKWVDIARALNGDPRGKPFEAAATMICAASDSGRAAFPLSTEHYFEIWKKRSVGPRVELAKTMASVSRNYALAPYEQLLPGEIDRALQRRFGRPTSLRPLCPFGWGISHLSDGLASAFPPEMRTLALAMHPELRSEQELAAVLEGMLLSGSPKDTPNSVSLPSMQFAREFADDQNELMRIYREHNIGKDQRRHHLEKEAFEGIFSPLDEALARAGISWDEFKVLERDGITDFILDLPSQMVILELMWCQCDNLDTNWEPNDLYDIGFLSVAVGYCDIVVTERKWMHMLNQGDAAKRAYTTVIRSLADLTELLVAA